MGGGQDLSLNRIDPPPRPAPALAFCRARDPAGLEGGDGGVGVITLFLRPPAVDDDDDVVTVASFFERGGILASR